MSERQAKAPTMSALLPSRLVPEDILSEWQGPNLPNTKNYAPPPDSLRGRMGDVLMQGIAALGGFTGLPMGGEGSKAALLGELLAAGMPLVGGIKALPGAKVLAGPAWEKALRFYAEAGGLAERHVPRMANALQRAGIKVPARSVAEKVAAHKIVNEALDLAHTPAGPVEGPFATPQGIKAFHGSPHDFDQFSLSKIGTGEGAQAYGHGLYFAENPTVARTYRDAVRGGAPDIRATRALEDAGGDKAKATDTLQTLMAKHDPLSQAYRDYEDALRLLDGKTMPRMYEVSINADPEDFLDWDAPALSTPQQKALRSLGVRRAEGGKDAYVAVRNKAIHAAGEHRGFKAPGIQDPNGLGDIGSRFDVDVSPSSPGGYEQADYDRIRQALAPHRGEMTPTEWVRVNAMTSGGDYDSVASQLLKDRGIPGIKYLDGASRSAGQGSRNYVVFDDTKISIVRKFGIAAALSAGAINELEARQMQAQGYQ